MVSTEPQSIGIHDIHLFNTELAVHYEAIFKNGFFQLKSRERLAMFLAHSCDKSKTGPE